MSDYFDNVDFPIDTNNLWWQFERNYNKFYLDAEPFMSIIPKKIHQVWVGSPVPEAYNRLRQTWIDLHPDWEYKLWTDKDAEDFGMKNKSLFDRIENNGSKADIFRYEIIYRHGGIYADTDFECIKPFDMFRQLSFFGGSGWTNNPCTFNGLFGAIPYHPILRKALEILGLKDIQPRNSLDKINSVTGADFLSDIATDYMQYNIDDRIVVFPKNFFYPFPPEKRLSVREDNEESRRLTHSYLTPKTHAIHLWYTSWQ